MKQFILVILALFIFIMIAPIGILWQCIRHLSDIPNYFFNIALSIDQAGNVISKKMFDDILINKDGYRFGNPDETISSVLGKNKQYNTLTILGKMLAGFLNNIETNHVEKAIDKTIKP